jgi:hypothetical protein
MLIIGEIL